MAEHIKSFESLTDNRVDPAASMIRGVCVVRIGEARGHNVFIDSRTLETVRDIGNSSDEGIKVKLRHSMPGVFQSILEESFGLLKNFSILGDKVIANLEVLQSVDEKLKAKAFEMANKMARQFGLSIDFKGTYEKIDGKDFLRCVSLESVDLTDKPAATDGLFSMKEPKYETGTSGKHSGDCMCAECEKSKMEAGGGKDGTHPLDSKMQALEAQVKQLVDAVSKLSTAPADARFESIIKRLDRSEATAAETAKQLEKKEREIIISQLSRESRVVMKEPGLAYKLEELQNLSLENLKFAAINSQVLPNQAKGIYTGTFANGPKEIKKFTKTVTIANGERKEVPLQGTELLEACYEEQYGDLNKMIAGAMGKLSN